MQLCESCGACRETQWRVCPFCQAQLSTTSTETTDVGNQFDALAAAAEVSDVELLPSPMPQEPEPEVDLLTAQDLAHLTGGGGPSVNNWDSSSPPPPAAEKEPTTPDGIDAPVSKLVVLPLVALALAAVAFVGYSILSASPSARPDTVALIDRPTTTVAPSSTTEPASAEPMIGPVGVDVAEQAARLCSGEQFSIARAEGPSLAIYNDLLVATRDGRNDWVASADDVTLRTVVPALIGCLTTADGGEIDRCATEGYVVSRRSVAWSYRVLQTVDGTELGSDSGTAEDVLPCEQLVTEAAGEDLASWSELPHERIDAVAADYTTAPHPGEACAVKPTNADEEPGEQVFAAGLSLHATFAEASDVDVELPEGWMATDDRPVEAVLCLERMDRPGETPATTATPASEPSNGDIAVEACTATIRVTAMHRDGRFLGSWDHLTEQCSDGAEPPNEWWLDAVGPALGYTVEAEGE